MKRKIVPMMIVGAMLTSAVPAQAATLPMFKQSETVTISREEYENYQRYQKLEALFQIVEAYYYEDVDNLVLFPHRQKSGARYHTGCDDGNGANHGDDLIFFHLHIRSLT